MDIVNHADLVLADGVGVVKGAAMLGTPLKGKVPGIEFAMGLMGKTGKKKAGPSICWVPNPAWRSWRENGWVSSILG